MNRLWLFQLSHDVYTQEAYRQEIWEGGLTGLWAQNKVRGDERPAAGDRIVCWCAKTVSPDPGLVGWGVIMQADELDLRWRPLFPTDLLKMAPLFDADLVACVDRIRRGIPQGTMWLATPGDAAHVTARVAASVGRVP